MIRINLSNEVFLIINSRQSYKVMPAKKSQPEYCVITGLKNKGILGARLLSRGEPYLPVDVTAVKRAALPEVGDIVLCDMTDHDSGAGTADILEIIDAKDIKKLRRDGTLPEAEAYEEFVFIKETHEDKRAKTKGESKVTKKGSQLEEGESGVPQSTNVETTEKSAENEEATVSSPKKEKKSTRSPQVKAATSPTLKPCKTSLETQMQALDKREGNAELDDI